MKAIQLTRKQVVELNAALQLCKGMPGITARLRYLIHKNLKPIQEEMEATLKAFPDLATTTPGNETKEQLTHLLGEVTLPLIPLTIDDLTGISDTSVPEPARPMRDQAIIEALDPIILPN